MIQKGDIVVYKPPRGRALQGPRYIGYVVDAAPEAGWCVIYAASGKICYSSNSVVTSEKLMTKIGHYNEVEGLTEETS